VWRPLRLEAQANARKGPCQYPENTNQHMLGPLWKAWQAHRENAALRRRAIPDDLWKRTLIRYPFLRRRDATDAAQLRLLTSLFLDQKEFSAAGGLRLTNAMTVAIAAQACLPILRLGLEPYAGFVGIVVHPDAVVARRAAVDEAGVMHEYDETLAGEAVYGGPVMLSWHDVRAAGQASAHGYNVVIHEFAHVLDMAQGAPNGLPLLPADITTQEWANTLEQEYTRFAERVAALGDAELESAAPAEGQTETAPAAITEPALDPYGAQSPEEFFAVASEAFFVNPGAMQAQHPALYALFMRLYKQDPQKETSPARGGA
jgi:MtfA peptidase